MLQQEAPEEDAKSSPWLAAVFVEKQESGRGKVHQDAKKQLVRCLREQLGVQSVQVGRFVMKLSENIPEDALKEACHDLLFLYRQDGSLNELTMALENCLNAWVITLRKTA